MAWENTKPLVVFRSRMNSFNSFIGELFTVGHGRRAAAAIAGAARRFRFLFAGRLEDGVQPRLPRVPHLEALPRRHGRRRVDLTISRPGTTENLTNNPVAGHLPDVGTGQQDLLHLRPR